MKSSEPFAYYDPDSSSWKTFEACLPLDAEGCSDEFSGRWPTQGTTRSGMAYALPTSEPATDGGESSLLPTPRATRGGSNTETVELLPTPTTQDEANNGGPSQHERNTPPPLNALAQRLA